MAPVKLVVQTEDVKEFFLGEEQRVSRVIVLEMHTSVLRKCCMTNVLLLTRCSLPDIETVGLVVGWLIGSR